MIAHFIYNGFMYVTFKLFQSMYIIKTYELPININDLNVRIYHRVLRIQPVNAFKSSIFFLILIQESYFFYQRYALHLCRATIGHPSLYSSKLPYCLLKLGTFF